MNINLSEGSVPEKRKGYSPEVVFPLEILLVLYFLSGKVSKETLLLGSCCSWCTLQGLTKGWLTFPGVSSDVDKDGRSMWRSGRGAAGLELMPNPVTLKRHWEVDVWYKRAVYHQVLCRTLLGGLVVLLGLTGINQQVPHMGPCTNAILILLAKKRSLNRKRLGRRSFRAYKDFFFYKNSNLCENILKTEFYTIS